ncbi:hypothetical protein PTKIN_Ptkin01aG0296800 [Pterospermum kingtungense]
MHESLPVGMHESQFIQDIVKLVQSKLHPPALYVPPYLVGIDSLVTRINWWLEEDGANEVGNIATICGIGGIGKTTIAKVIYNQNIHRFEGYSFLADIRETSEDGNGWLRLQRQLISDIVQGKSQKIYNVDNGINKIKEAICCRKVLLVLDDVDDLEKITKIIGAKIPFHPGSKIIITSRYRHLLSAPFIGQMFDLEASSTFAVLWKIFEVKELAFNESLQLFNWYAFGRNSIPESFTEYTSTIVKHCGGIPLALQVLGSSLSGKSINVWRSALEKLEAIPDIKIQKILRISYDSLPDDHDKNLFLDIACFFIGKDRDYTTTILDGCDFYTAVGIENLISKSLLIVNERNKLMMHQMIRDMGREIIRQENSDLGKRNRLWHKDAFDVITGKNGSETVKCLSIDLQGLLEDKSRGTTTSLHFAKNSKNQLLMLNELDLETEAFAKMQRLKLLQLDYVKFKGDFKDFPRGLIWLRWHGFPLQFLPPDFDIKRLVVLDMRHSSLKKLWKDTECLPRLKILNLNHSHRLLKTPNFSGLPSLEKLMLKDCVKLIKVDRSIGELKTLRFLTLKDCKSLVKLPRTIGLLVSLEVLILSGCSRLNVVLKELNDMESLRELHLDETAIHQSKSRMSWISLKRREELGFFWASLPCSLVKLSLESCRLSDEVMPNDLSSLLSLKYLNLSRNPLCRLPDSIKNLTKLDELRLTSCTKLQVIPKLPILSSLAEVYFSPTTVGLVNLTRLFSSKRCVIFGCERLIEVQDIFKMKSIETFEAEEIRCLFNMDSIDNTKVQLYNYLTDTKISVTPQVLQESGISSTFVSGSEVPTWFEHHSKGPQIAFSLPRPSHSGEKISCFNLCIVFSFLSDQIFEFKPSLNIFNETKEIMRVYSSSLIGIPETNNNTMLWLIHWPAMDFQLEGDDFLSCRIIASGLNIKEFGVTCASENNMKYESEFQLCSRGNEEHVTRNIYLELTQVLNNVSSCGNVKVQFDNHLEESKTVTSPQVFYDCGIIYEFDPSKDASFHQNCNFVLKPKISFTVPPNSSQKICWLKLVSKILYSINDKTCDFFPRVEIVNETKGTKWSHSKHFVGIPETKSTVITWLNCWKFKEELEAGDRVNLTVISDLHLKESCVDLFYDFEPVDEENLVDQYLPDLSKCSGRFFTTCASILFKSQRTLYRMSLVKK